MSKESCQREKEQRYADDFKWCDVYMTSARQLKKCSLFFPRGNLELSRNSDPGRNAWSSTDHDGETTTQHQFVHVCDKCHELTLAMERGRPCEEQLRNWTDRSELLFCSLFVPVKNWFVPLWALVNQIVPLTSHNCVNWLFLAKY
jgi:hypothetical protein